MHPTRVLSLTVAMIALIAVAATPTASAAKRNPYTAAGVCGPGYEVVNRAPMFRYGRLLAGTVLTYKRSTGRYCAVTLKRRWIGRPSWTEVYLRREGGPRQDHRDYGSFSYYAGPVYNRSADRCLGWGGKAHQLVRRQGNWWAAVGEVSRVTSGCR